MSNEKEFNKQQRDQESRLTVREVKVMHIPPKPLKISAIKISTESSGTKHTLSLLHPYHYI